MLTKRSTASGDGNDFIPVCIDVNDTQGYCLIHVGTQSPEAPKLQVRTTKDLFKELKRLPNRGVFILI